VFTKNCWDAFVSLEDQLLKQKCVLEKHGLNKKEKHQLLSQSKNIFLIATATENTHLILHY
jgi:hypothetical protein